MRRSQHPRVMGIEAADAPKAIPTTSRLFTTYLQGMRRTDLPSAYRWYGGRPIHQLPGASGSWLDQYSTIAWVNSCSDR